MPLTYVKLEYVLADIADGILSRAGVLASIVAADLAVVNLKGYILTVADFDEGEEAGR